MTKRKKDGDGGKVRCLEIDDVVESNSVIKGKGTVAKAKPKAVSQLGSGDLDNEFEGTKSKSSSKRKKRVPKLTTVEKSVLQNIIGQDKQVRQIITAIYRTINFPSIKSNILIIGNSGTGKTETIRQIAKILNIPYTIEDATKYTQEGYYGNDVQEMVYNLVENADGDYYKAERGMIVIDEIDKKAGHEEHDVAGVEVLKSLLKIVEGTVIKMPLQEDEFDDSDGQLYDFDTRNLIIIFLGAFSGLEKIREKRLGTNKIGFASDAKKIAISKDTRFLKRDLVQYGMPEEFVGRIDSIIEMNKLTKEDLSLILKKSQLSIFKRYQRELSKKNIILTYKPEIFEKIAEQSLELDTGARELSNTVNHIFENIMYEVLANPRKYCECILNSDIVNDNTKYELIEKS